MNVNATNVKDLAERKQNENFDLRSYLKMQDRLLEEEVAQLVADTANRILASFDCTACGNCCKELGRTVSQKEVEQLAAALAISEEEFRGRYLEVDADATEDECEHEMFVMIRWEKPGLAVPLAQLKAVAADDSTTKTVEDWCYWEKQGYEF
ncbi:MAG: hypothetical protein EHM48_04045 [Planctomycetaceae bacterium]|nr:MAG: hypothetical protein EHM48_04045 [Planctomycetaceae bacterium]